jgi:hypothetical protein
MPRAAWIIAATLASMLSVTALAADYSIAPVGSLGFSNFAAGNAAVVPYFGAGSSFGGGLLASVTTHPDYEWELGLLYAPRTIDLQTPSGDSLGSQTFDDLEFPVDIHYNGVRPLSFGMGGYYAHALSSPNPSIRRNDLGIVATGGARFPLSPTLSILLDVRGIFGILNLDQTPRGLGTLRHRGAEILVGLKFSL